jgi:hypothetical protein
MLLQDAGLETAAGAPNAAGAAAAAGAAGWGPEVAELMWTADAHAAVFEVTEAAAAVRAALALRPEDWRIHLRLGTIAAGRRIRRSPDKY